MTNLPLNVATSLSALAFLLGGCTGVRTFTAAARAGDTVALAVGWQQVSRQNIQISIVPAGGGTPISYGPTDTRIRAVVNLYPDPVSNLVVGTQTAQAMSGGANVYGSLINWNYTDQDNDWSQSLVILDLPSSLPQGTASISVMSGSVSLTPSPIAVEILPGAGSANDFAATGSIGGGYVNASMLQSLERAPNYSISFSGSVVPHSIQAEFAHTPGVGKAWVTNSRGDIKSVAWSDDGANIRVIVTPTIGQTLPQMKDLRFYISGGVTGLTLNSLKAYDVNGNLLTGLLVNVQ